MLKRELEAYESHKEELLGKAAGKFVLIKNDEILGTYDTANDAINRGYELFGNVPFLVKEIIEIETPAEFTSNLIAV
jgi:hypothetical protein